MRYRSGVRGTVLIIEDEHDIRVTLRQALEEVGFFVVSATNGAAALDLLGQMTAPRLILLDLNMPLMNGDQFLQVQQADPKLRTIPVIQMSASKTHQRPGTRCALTKPLDLGGLIKTIEACLVAVPTN
jgi:two-component system, chemotaxis family, chemotaxis protein CheY